MSIVAWRLFMIALIGRTDPNIPCIKLLADYELATPRIRFLFVGSDFRYALLSASASRLTALRFA
jgi:hypothetical protein